MKKGPIFVLMLGLLCMPLSSAYITLPAFNPLYNLGDTIASTAKISLNYDMNGFFKLSLECSNSSNDFFALPMQLKANEQRQIDVPSITLARSGDCLVSAKLESQKGDIIERQQSPGFYVSEGINISLTLNKEVFMPDEKIRIEGIAVKENGKPVNGIVTMTLSNTYTANVKDGRFIIEETIWGKIKGGDHEVIMNVRDNDGNHGEIAKKIKVRQVPSSLIMRLNKDSFNPGDKIEAKASLLDQAEDEISEGIILTLYDSWGAEIARKEVYNETFEYFSKNSDVPGSWWIYAYSEELKSRKFIYMNELKSIDIEMSGSSMNVTNTGNAMYNGHILLNFIKSDEKVPETIDIALGVGQKKSFELRGNGTYRIEVRSNEFSRAFEPVILTGGAIGAKAVESPIRMIIAISFVLAIAIFAGFLKIREKKNIIVKETVTVNENRI